MSDFTGTWRLTGYSPFDETVSPLIPEEAWEEDPAAAANALEEAFDRYLGELPTDIPEFEDATGRELTIHPDGSFTESGVLDQETITFQQPDPWEGKPFDGQVDTSGDFAVLIADGIDRDGPYRHALTQELQLTDSLQLIDGHLVRCQSVISDQVDPGRCWLRYERV